MNFVSGQLINSYSCDLSNVAFFSDMSGEANIEVNLDLNVSFKSFQY